MPELREYERLQLSQLLEPVEERKERGESIVKSGRFIAFPFLEAMNEDSSGES